MSFINKTLGGAGAALPSAGSGSASNSNASASENLSALRADLTSLVREFTDATEDRLPEFRKRLSGLAGNVEHESSRLLGQAYDASQELRSRARAELTHARDAAETYIADHPWRAIGAIAAATLAISLLLNRRF